MIEKKIQRKYLPIYALDTYLFSAELPGVPERSNL